MCQTHAARARRSLPPLLLAFWHGGLGRCVSVGQVRAALAALVSKRRVSLVWMACSREGAAGACALALRPSSLKRDPLTHAVQVPPLRGAWALWLFQGTPNYEELQ